MNRECLRDVISWAQAAEVPVDTLALSEECPPAPSPAEGRWVMSIAPGWLEMVFGEPVAPAVPGLLARVVEDAFFREEQEFQERAFLHEVMNPLAVISGHLELLQRECHNARRFSAIWSAMRQIRQHLDNWSQRYLPVEREWFRVDSAWRLVLKELGPEIANRQVACHYEGWRGELYSDRERVHQILFNLAKNGLEALGRGGTMTLKADYAPDQVRLTMRDTAGGVRADVQPGLFAAGVSSKGSGRGFGVALSWRIARLLGGLLEYEPEDGGAFVLTLPTGGPAPGKSRRGRIPKHRAAVRPGDRASVYGSRLS
ncbi:MAG: HAMP domain-containing sensor histidine kinase [Thermaerobacter sp.]|nr:HAMP domain-containing sensor histidine kinase [Thermaerobacter sp.]